MQSIKETAVNVAASAKSGMDKTKAVVQEKVEKIAAGNSTEKQIATERKEEKIHNAELGKQQMKQAAHAGGAYSHSTNGTTGQPTGSHQMSALPGHGTGAPAGQVVEGTVKSHPIGAATDTGTGRPNTAHNTHVGGGTNTGYGTGQPIGNHQMSAFPGHCTGAPDGQGVEETVESHPIGAATGTGTGRPNTAHDTHVGSGTNTGYGTGGAWSG